MLTIENSNHFLSKEVKSFDFVDYKNNPIFISLLN